MAKIPQFGNIQLNGARANVPSNAISMGSGIRRLGDGLNAIADLMLQKKKEDDQLQYQKALLDLDEFGSNELNNPDTGYENLQGENAINQSSDYNQRYIDKAGEIRENLKGNMFLSQYDLQTQNMHTSFSRQLMDHESRQQSALALKTMQSGIELAVTNAQSLYNDPMSLDIGYKNLITRVDQFSSEQGMPEELRKTQIEGIKQNYFSSSLDGWIANTELAGGSFIELGEQMKESFAFNQLSEINQAKYLLKLDALTKRQGNEYKDSLKLDLNNAWEMQKRGIEAPNISIDRFNLVYGDQGKQAYDAYQDQQVMARNIGAMQNMPTNDLISYTQENISDGPTVGQDQLSANTQDDNFADRLKLQNVRSQAALTLLKARYDDPIAAAYQAGEIEQISYDDIETSLTKRVAQATRISNDYKTPLKVFSNNEATHLSKMINEAGATQQAELLKTFSIVSGGNDSAYNAMLNDVGLENPVFAAAGNILNSGGNSNYVTTKKNLFTADNKTERQAAATFILKGMEALKGTGKGDAKIKGVSLPTKSLEEFDSITGTLFIDDPLSRQNIYSAAMAYYVGKSISTGTYSNTKEIDSDLLKESINAVAGNQSSKYNTRMPWGMDEDTFQNHVNAQYEKLAQINGWKESDTLSNYNYDPQDPYRITLMGLEERFTLIPSTYSSGLPDGKYFLKAGNGFLVDNQGKPVIIDVLSDKYSVEDIPE